MTEADANATVLTSVPKDVEGKPIRRPDGFAIGHVLDFSDAVESFKSGRVLEWEISLEPKTLTAVKNAHLDGRRIQHPAGIPGYDHIFIRGTRELHLAKPRGVLVWAGYRFIPGGGEGRPPVWMAEFGFRITKLTLPPKRLPTDSQAIPDAEDPPTGLRDITDEIEAMTTVAD